MHKNKNLNPLMVFIMKSFWITTLILLPATIIGKGFFQVEEWLTHNPYNGLWIVIPAGIILLRRFFKMTQKSI